MSLQITPDMLVSAYELLRTTPPFKRWRMPDADDVEFKVSRNATTTARLLLRSGETPVIEVSSRAVSTLAPLLMAIAHEMVHLNEHLSGDMRSDCMHGREYRRRAKRVCDVHRFDPMQFGGLE